MRNKILLILLTFMLVAFATKYQNELPKLILEKLESYSQNEFPEKVYVQTDKTIYAKNETIWFAGYLVNGVNHLKSTKSFVLHVDLLDELDSIVAHRRLFINEISEAGDFEIDKNWKPGNYRIRAYTNFMRNDDSAYFFYKELLILGAENMEVKKSNAIEKELFEFVRPSLEFYPEGGNLIVGVQNKVALKLSGVSEGVKDITGRVVDTDGNEVSKFQIYEFGLGVLNFIPQDGKMYYASIDYNGNEEHYPLPKALLQGYGLSVINQGENIVIHPFSNNESGLKGTFLVAHQRGQTIFQKYQEEELADYSILLNAADFDDGVVHLTLFDSTGVPVSERLFFVNNTLNDVDVVIKNNESELSTRNHVVLELSAKDQAGNLTAGNFSMAVRDVKVLGEKDAGETIKTWLLLNSDLRGALENPKYFFEVGEENKKRFLLDLVMLTNGWRRFSWHELLKEQTKPNQFKIERGIFISGVVKNLKSPYEPLAVPTRLTLVKKQPYQEVVESDENGNFSFGPFVFFDAMPTLIEARKTDLNSEKNSDRKVLISIKNNENYPEFIDETNYSRDEVDLTAMLNVANYLNQIKAEYGENVNELDEVLVKGKAKTDLDRREEEMDARTIYGSPTDRVVTADERGAEWKTVLEVLRARPGIQPLGNGISLRGRRSPAFYLDGMEIDSTYIGTIYANDVSFIDILKGPDANIYSNSNNGVVAIYSKIGTEISVGSVKRQPGIIDFSSQGFYVAREFYSPDHINGFEEQSKPDSRTTLYWNPEIKLKSNEIYRLSFFTGDLKGEYEIEIEGLTTQGVPVNSKSHFVVE